MELTREEMYKIILDEISRHTRPPIQKREQLASQIATRLENAAAVRKIRADEARAEQAAAFKHPARQSVEAQKSV